MPIHERYLADFNEQGIYHIFNRTNNNELLFYTDEIPSAKRRPNVMTKNGYSMGTIIQREK